MPGTLHELTFSDPEQSSAVGTVIILFCPDREAEMGLTCLLPHSKKVVNLRAEARSDYLLDWVEGVSASDAWLPSLCAPRRQRLCPLLLN
jgi:hypothetical protein